MSNTIYDVVDLSQHNGTVDFKALATSVKAVVLRIGWCGNTENKLDTKFNEYYREAKKAGLKVGGYVYMYTKTPTASTKGAKWTLEQIKGKTFELPIYCDMEDKTIQGLSKTTLTNIAVVFCNEIKKAGYYAGIYASLYWWKKKLDGSLVKKYYSWVAHYTNGIKSKYKGKYGMWQYTSTGKVSGVKGNVDKNYLYNYFFIEGRPTSTTPAPKPQPKKNYFQKYEGSSESIVDALNSMGYSSNFAYRRNIARVNGILNYVGTAYQNTKLLSKLKQGVLIKP